MTWRYDRVVCAVFSLRSLNIVVLRVCDIWDRGRGVSLDLWLLSYSISWSYFHDWLFVVNFFDAGLETDFLFHFISINEMYMKLSKKFRKVSKIKNCKKFLKFRNILKRWHLQQLQSQDLETISKFKHILKHFKISNCFVCEFVKIYDCCVPFYSFV